MYYKAFLLTEHEVIKCNLQLTWATLAQKGQNDNSVNMNSIYWRKLKGRGGRGANIIAVLIIILVSSG